MTELRPKQDLLVLKAENAPESQKVAVRRVNKVDKGREIAGYNGLFSNAEQVASFNMQREAQLQAQTAQAQAATLEQLLDPCNQGLAAQQRAYAPGDGLMAALGG